MRHKLKGKFKLMINKDLKREIKIRKYADEPISFYLHMNRNFLKKIDDQHSDDRIEKESQE